jgi:hypothetical protein
MKEFVLFVRYFFRLVHFTRGVLLVLLAALLVATALIALVEDWTLGRALSR